MSEIYGNGQFVPPAFQQPRREYFTKRQTLGIALGSAAAALVIGLGGAFGISYAVASPSTGSTGTSSSSQQGGFPGQSGTGSSGGQLGSSGSSSQSGSSTSGSASDASYATSTAATTDQSQGIVIIETALKYQDAEAAGTGMVLTKSGEILTNNHVIAGATSIEVEVVSTGKTYTATVVGTDATDDVAVLQLTGASGLTTADLDTSGSVAVGDAVTGVGNAGGGGELLAASGEVTALDQSITTEAEGAAESESLSGLIETDAAIQSGDSGGPLYDDDGEIVGMDTAAAASGPTQSYAIPITSALDIAEQITSGDTSDTDIQLGNPAFLGVELATDESSSATQDSDGFGASSGTEASGGTDATSTESGAEIAGVISGSPAASAGLEEGDVITAVDGSTITTSDELSAALKKHDPGDTATITWTDADGASHTASVTLIEGPAA